MTIRSIDDPDLDTADVSTTYRRRVGAVRPDLLPMAIRLLERLPPERWMLEWHMPWWLGNALGLDREVTRELVVSNLLGLGSIRIQDDLADGDVAPRQAAAAKALAPILYGLALDAYRFRFPAESPFWTHLETCLSDWRAATGEEGRLAARGAPLKISAFAVCRLTERVDVFPAVDRLLDEALEALVLYDHIADWRDDLDAGRWNAFVADISDGPQLPAERTRHRRAVLVAMMTTNAIGAHIGRVEAGLLGAADLGETLGVPVPALVAHLRTFARQAGEQGRELQAHYRDLGDRAASLLLDPPGDGRS